MDWGTISFGDTTLAVTQLVGAIIFAVASFTDWLDGKIARAQGLVTNFGKFADPLADKMLVMTAFIVLVGQGKVPAWIVAIIVCRIGSNWFTVVISRTWRSNGSSLARKSKNSYPNGCNYFTVH